MIGFAFFWLCLMVFTACGVIGQGYIGLGIVGLLCLARFIYGRNRNPRRIDRNILEGMR